MSEKISTRLLAYLRLIPLLCAAIVVAHLCLALWSFPQDDDFSFAADAIKNGVFGNTVMGYMNWEGRFESYFLVGLAGWSDLFPYHTNLIVTASLTLFTCSLVLALRWIDGSYSSILGLDIAFIFLALPRQVKQQAFYWLDGNIEYLLPVSVTCLTLALLGKAASLHWEKPALLAITLIFLVLGGFNPILSASLMICIGGHLVSLPSGQGNAIKRWKAALLGVTIGLLIVVAAPGNYVRLHNLNAGHNPNIFKIGMQSLRAVWAIVPPFLVTCLAYGFLRSRLRPTHRCAVGNNAKTCAWLSLCVLAVVLITFYGIVYGYNARYPSARTLLAPFILIFMLALVVSSWLTHRIPLFYPFKGRLRYARRILLLLAVLVALPSALAGFSDLLASLQQAPVQRRAALAQIDAAYHAKAGKNTGTLNVEPIPNQDSLLIFKILKNNPNKWKNASFARYFGLSQVVSNPE